MDSTSRTNDLLFAASLPTLAKNARMGHSPLKAIVSTEIRTN
jgi:hypothetical protein